jgi:hypothetical protein
LKQIKASENTGLSLGWTKGKSLAVFTAWGAFFNELLGIFMSGLLISFGASFWRDLLSSFSGLKKILQVKERRKPGVPPPLARTP